MDTELTAEREIWENQECTWAGHPVESHESLAVLCRGACWLRAVGRRARLRVVRMTRASEDARTRGLYLRSTLIVFSEKKNNFTK